MLGASNDPPSMRLSTIRTAGVTRAVRLEGDVAVELEGADVGELLRLDDWRSHAAHATGPRHDVGDVELAPLVPRPSKVFCVGLNYRSHIEEMGREVPAHPTLFAKFASALIGACDDIELPAPSSRVDWEAELGIVIGARCRRVDEADAAAAIAGFTVINDLTARDFQRRTTQWLQGKTFEGTTPIGPCLLVADEPPAGPVDFLLRSEVNGIEVQRARTSDLVFGPAALVSYLSEIVTLEPGDIIATGTPGGVGDARTPPWYLEDGDLLVTEIEGIGRCVNRCRRNQHRS